VTAASPSSNIVATFASTPQPPPSKPKTPHMASRPPVPLSMDYDVQALNEYQCLLRNQIELFENGPDDIKGKAQGRNIPVQIGQVYAFCSFCESCFVYCIVLLGCSKVVISDSFSIFIFLCYCIEE
jgi:hypothetical protein